MTFSDSTFYPDTSPGYLVRMIHQMNVAAVDRALAGDGLTATQWTTLVSLYFGHADTCVGLARKLGHDKGAMTRLIDQMEHKGWVSRQRDDDDRRLIRLSLTPSGERTALAAKRKVIDCWNGFLADWSEAEIAALIATLQRLRQTMDEKMAEEGNSCAV